VCQSQADIDELIAALGNRFSSVAYIRVGGQGTVFRAIRTMDPKGATCNDSVALKIHTGSTDNVRVDREIGAIDGFDHPCLASFVEHGIVELKGTRYRYIAWRFIDGSALDDRIKLGPVSAKAVACIGRDVARAIEHIWQKRIVHRDISPKNIMLSPREDAAVLIDLGVARFLDLQVLTAAGRTWGTPGYFSPEQWAGPGENLTCYSDVFALGISLQEALCGRHPTFGNHQLLFTNPIPTGVLCPAVPAALASLIDRCLQLRPPFRPNPTSLAQELAVIAAMLN
jgi:serine/threonine protein kinase